MKYSPLFLLFGLISTCLWPGCIDPIEFSGTPTPPNLVVSGVISNHPDRREISLAFNTPPTIGVSNDTTLPAARIFIWKGEVQIGEFELTDEGKYLLPDSIQIMAGNAYHITVDFSNGESYRSLPEMVRAPLSPDSLTAKYEFRNVDFTDANSPRRWFIDLFAHNTIDANEGAKFFRWEIDADWEQVELDDPNSPFDRILICYYHLSINLPPVRIQDGSIFQEGSISKNVFSRQLGDAFKDRHVINVYQHSITPEAYRFYEKVDLLVNSTGSLFDQIPAAIPGNVQHTFKPEERVLGYVEFSLADTSRFWVQGREIPANFPLGCRSPENARPYCFDCIQNSGASYEKPDYWD